MTSPSHDSPTIDELPITISGSFVADILAPYRPNARYLESAQVTHIQNKSASFGDGGQSPLMSGTGRFAIPESCYIDDTGHFNAVEFNICYNQLAYVLFGKCVNEGLLQGLRHEKVSVPTFPEFKRHQLPSMLIVSIEGVRFFKQLKSEAFEGQFTLNRMAPVGAAWFFFTSIAFSDTEGVKAKGSVVLAFSPTFAPAR
jgi:hypothetical protein